MVVGLAVAGRAGAALADGQAATQEPVAQRAGHAGAIYAAVTGCGWTAVLKAFGVSLVFNLLNVMIHWLCGRAVGMQLGLGYFFVVTPLMSVGGLIPSIGGWGVRESDEHGRRSHRPASDANVAAALGVSMGAVGLSVGLLGGLLYAIEGRAGACAGARSGAGRAERPLQHPRESHAASYAQLAQSGRLELIRFAIALRHAET